MVRTPSDLALFKDYSRSQFASIMPCSVQLKEFIVEEEVAILPRPAGFEDIRNINQSTGSAVFADNLHENSCLLI